MDYWQNIEIPDNDPEIIRINEMEKRLGDLPKTVYKVRELITRHEVCHFKFRHHIEKIKSSISILKPYYAPEKIGSNHIQHGENAWKQDSTGKSLLGQQYVWAIKKWLDDLPSGENPQKYDEALAKTIHQWLGDKNDEKVRLVQLLISRMTWDWPLFEKLQVKGEFEKLEWQISRIDICHFDFPNNLDLLLRGIGQMTANDNWKGCGSFNGEIVEFIKKELLLLSDRLKYYSDNKTNTENPIRAWLTACFIKTLKEQIGEKQPLIEF